MLIGRDLGLLDCRGMRQGGELGWLHRTTPLALVAKRLSFMRARDGQLQFKPVADHSASTCSLQNQKLQPSEWRGEKALLRLDFSRCIFEER